MKRFHHLGEFDQEHVAALVQLAQRLEKHPEPTALAGKVLSLLFLSPSLRTLASFQAGMARLGGGAFVISPDMSIHGLESRDGIVMDGSAAEHIREAVPVIASYGDAMGLRAFADRKNLDDDIADQRFLQLTDLIDTPWINMESAMSHPCQSLADWKTLDDHAIPANGGKFVLSWAWHPKALPLAVPSSTVHMAAMRGMDVTVLAPEGFELPPAIIEGARTAAEASGGSLTETSDRNTAMQDAHVIYAKSWSSTQHYGNKIADEKARADLKDWCVDEPWFANARTDCRFMHCLPVRRGVVVSDDILDGPRSIVIAEARNRMLAQMAVLYDMMGAGA